MRKHDCVMFIRVAKGFAQEMRISSGGKLSQTQRESLQFLMTFGLAFFTRENPRFNAKIFIEKFRGKVLAEEED